MDVNNPDYPLGKEGKDFVLKCYLEMIPYMTFPDNLYNLWEKAREVLEPGEQFDRVTDAIDAKLKDLREAKKGGRRNA